ncbi:MAG: protein-disulfide reductase DsbD family protein [Bacteroidota bacterium]
MNKTTKFLSVIAFFTFLFTSVSSTGQILEPVSWSFDQKKISEDIIELRLTADIEKDWSIYATDIKGDGPVPTSFTFKDSPHYEKVGNLKEPKGKEEYDNTFEMVLKKFSIQATFTQQIRILSSNDFTLEGELEYMACDDSRCLAPTLVPYEFSISGVSGKAAAEDIQENQATKNKEQAENNYDASAMVNQPDTSEQKDSSMQGADDASAVSEAKSETDIFKPVIDQVKKYKGEEDNASRAWWVIFFIGFVGGLVALLTPCVWPMIPMTVSFFLKRSGSSRRKGIRDAFIYGIGIIIIYVSIGLGVTLAFGADALNSLSTNAFFNLLFFLLLVIFAIAFLGGFELTLPSKWTNAMDSRADKTSGIISIFFMAFTLALVSFSCTGPIIGTLLVEAAVSGARLGPFMGMLGFSVALAIPFTLFAVFPSMLNSMPKSGSWLNSVKVVLGFLELALAFKFLSVADLSYHWGILNRDVFLAIWIVLFTLLGMYFIGKIRFPGDSEMKTIPVARLFLGIAAFSFAVYMIPGMWGAPVKAVSAFAPPPVTQDFSLYDAEVHAQFTDYEEGMRYAKEHNKPALIDFTGWGCVNCRKMENSVWTDARVHDMLLNDFVLISLYVDDKTKLPEDEVYEVTENNSRKVINTVGRKWSYLQRNKFGNNSQPFYVILDHDGNLLTRPYGYDKSVPKYIKWMQNGMKAYKQHKVK